MQEDIDIVSNTKLLELVHLQTNTSFELPLQDVIRIGKPNDLIIPEVNVSSLPDTDIVSRQHAEIHRSKDSYYIVDNGSVNGTYLNDELLEPLRRYLLKLGDTISLGKGNKVAFILQHKLQAPSSSYLPASRTVFQPEAKKLVQQQNQTTQVDKTSKFIGLALMVASVIVFAANTQVGLFVRIPGVLLCISGAVFLLQRRFNRNFGWVLIALGIGIIIFTGNLLASVNLLAIVCAAALFVVGYLLMRTGKVFGYGIDALLKGKFFKK
ncbi:MAG: FHA domain-containing protein [Calothrix sp. FI2-JRJ7]|jgi:pSer/pThr/pTyr-binding forkhead associated (FHA) protein|nr:FHA domain-containing protein [Calothrix sp. FI2-JRJ7]